MSHYTESAGLLRNAPAPAVSAPPARLCETTSIYLDLVRFSAAMVVMLGHLSDKRFTGGLLWQIEPFMREAVAVFFVLSGFVICHATDRPNTNATNYVLDRAARLYSVALPALAITFLLDSLGRAIDANMYFSAWGYQAAHRAMQFAVSLVFCNEIWGAHVSPGSALPYWSLGFEVFYYIAFGLAVFARGWERAVLLTATAVFVGPLILAFLPLWLLGVAAYRFSRKTIMAPRTGLALWLGTIGAWAAYEMILRQHMPLLPIWDRAADMANDYVAGALFTVNIVAMRAAAPFFTKFLRPVGGVIHFLAGATFTIYLLHMPIAQFLATVAPAQPGAFSTRMFMIGGTLLALFAIAEVTERSKRHWRRAFAFAFQKLAGTSPVFSGVA